MQHYKQEITAINDKQQILSIYIYDVKEAKLFTILADKLTSQNQEQIVFCIRIIVFR